MSAEVSGWIPRRRIRIAVGIACALAGAALVGTVWSLAALALLVPALGAGWAAFVMLRIRHQLSPRGGGWEDRIHDLVVSRIALPPDSQASALDIGCGDARLLARLLAHAPAVTPTGVDLWGTSWDYAQTACEERLAGQGHRATFHRMDAANLQFPDECFDTVVSVMCFHEVRSPTRAPSGPLLAVGEALRVLRPGGIFVLLDRFDDEETIDAVLRATTGLRREPLVSTLGAPWPLRSERALGPVEMLSGRKAAVS